MLLVCLLAVGVALGRFQSQARDQGRADFITQTFQVAVVPASSGITGGRNHIFDWSSALFNSGELSRRANRAKELEQISSQYQEAVDFWMQESARLRRLLELPDYANKTKVPAIAVRLEPFEHRLTLNRGSSDGIKVGMPVINGDGFVGTVQTVSGKTCQVLLVSSSQLRVGALVGRTPAPAGLIRGEAVNKMILDIVDVTATVQSGDLVLTSGHSDLIPPGIPIGIVSEVNKYPEFGSIRCQVFPNVSPGDVREVQILR